MRLSDARRHDYLPATIETSGLQIRFSSLLLNLSG
jgi:hypothetical protein